MPLRIMEVERVEIVRVGESDVTTCHGVVRQKGLLVGDELWLVDAADHREPALVAGVLPAQEGQKTYDQAEPGDRVQPVPIRRSPRLEAFVAMEAAG